MEMEVTRIRSDAGWRPLALADLWRRRGLLYVFMLRDLKASYKQTVLGPVWTVMPPLMTTVLFTVLFGLLMGRGKEPTLPGVPYALSTLCALLPWRLFAGCLTAVSNSLANNQSLIAKVYFPRLIFPLSAMVMPLLDALVTLLMLLILMLCYGFVPGWALLTVPLFILFSLATALALGLWIAPLSASYRDVGMAVPYFLNAAMYVSPVIYAAASLEKSLPPWLMRIYWLNPVTGAIEGVRWAMFGSQEMPVGLICLSAAMVVVLLVSGAYFFRRMERNIVDVL